MKLRKHECVVTINHFDGDAPPLKYTYRNCKDIELYVGDNGIKVRYMTTVPIDPDKLIQLKYDWLKDAIRKACIISALHSQKPFPVHFILFSIDHDQPLIYTPESNQSAIYSMLNAFPHRISRLMDDPQIFSLICSFNKSKEKEDSRFSSLFSYLVSKTKVYEIERFIYLWMSINGFYSHLARIVKDDVPATDRGKMRCIYKSEEDAIRFLALVSGYKYEAFFDKGAIENSLIRMTEIELSKVENVLDEQILNDTFANIMDKCKAIDKSGRDPPMDYKAFFTLWFPYKLRCKYFHAEQPIPMICFSDEYMLRVIGNVNTILENFLDTELPLSLNGEYLKKISRAREIAQTFLLKSEMKR